MKVWKEIGKGAAAFAVWMLVFVLMALVDEAVGCWITDCKVTQIMVQCIIQGNAVIVLLRMKAKMITAIGLNILLLVMMWVITDEGMAHSMAIVMMLGIIPAYLCEKGE